MATTSKTRWGILSTSNFALTKVLPALQQTAYCEVAAIASRDSSAAQRVAAAQNIPVAYGSYEALLADAEIDVIYNPLPNHLHVEWSIKALEAGKHVLCEKPVGLTAADATRLLEAAARFPSLKVMEAFMYRHHPQWVKAKELIQAGTIGDLKAVQCFFSYYNANPENIRNKADIGGGGMLDIGCYCISQARYLFDKEPLRAIGLLEFDPVMKTDRLASGMLDFSSGMATFTCSTQLMPYQRVNALGTQGRIEIDIPFNAPLGEPTHMRCVTEKGSEAFTFTANQYTLQGDLFARAVLDNTEVPTPLTDGVGNMRAIDAVVRSHDSGQWEVV